MPTGSCDSGAIVQMLAQIGGRCRRSRDEPASTSAMRTTARARTGCMVVPPRTCLSVLVSAAWHSCRGALAGWSWALTGGQTKPTSGRASTTRANVATSSLRDERTCPLSRSTTRVPTPSVQMWTFRPSRCRSKRSSRPARTKLRGAPARACATRSGDRRTSPDSLSTVAPASANRSSATALGNTTPTSARTSSVASLRASSCSAGSGSHRALRVSSTRFGVNDAMRGPPWGEAGRSAGALRSAGSSP